MASFKQANSATAAQDVVSASLSTSLGAVDLAYSWSEAETTATTDTTVSNLAASFNLAPSTTFVAGEDTGYLAGLLLKF
jgi:hypothetical protein